MNMNEKEIEEKINEVEKQLGEKLTILNYDYYDKLLEIHKKLWDLLYFKINQQETFLLK